jgi:hypothetical protein
MAGDRERRDVVVVAAGQAGLANESPARRTWRRARGAGAGGRDRGKFEPTAKVERLAGRAAPASPTVRQAPVERPRQRQQRLTPDQITELIAAYQAGADMKVLAGRWKLHPATVAAHLRPAGVPLRRQGISEAQLVEVVRLYEAGGSCAGWANGSGVTRRRSTWRSRERGCGYVRLNRRNQGSLG